MRVSKMNEDRLVEVRRKKYLNELLDFYNERVEKTYESLVHRMNRLKSFPLTILE